jgi:hypothetical protein
LGQPNTFLVIKAALLAELGGNERVARRLTQGSVALSLCNTTHPLHAGLANIFGT